MTRKFCPRCGRPTDRLYDNICSKCFLEKVDVEKYLPDKISISVCRNCGKFYVKDKPFNSTESALDEIFRTLKHKNIESISYRISHDRIIATIYFDVQGLKGNIKKFIMLKQTRILCKNCTMRSTGYFTSTLQLRGKFDHERIMKEVNHLIENMKQNDEMAFISKTVEKSGSVDLFLGSKSAANKIAKYMKDKYRATTKFSRTLYGKKQGKQIYRDTILLLFGE